MPPKKNETKTTPKTKAKPAVKPATKPAAASFRPLPEATPRYAPPLLRQDSVEQAQPLMRDASWALSLSFWWAQTWRYLLIFMPANLLIQFAFFAMYGGDAKTPEDFPLLTFLAVLMTLYVAVQVAVLRYMLRKKHFKGFTFTLTRR
jgi:hypothetical protein